MEPQRHREHRDEIFIVCREIPTNNKAQSLWGRSRVIREGFCLGLALPFPEGDWIFSMPGSPGIEKRNILRVLSASVVNKQ